MLTRPDANNGEQDHLFPSVLPGGRGVLFTVYNRSQQLGVAVLDLRTRRWRTVIRSGSQAEYVETGHVIYMDGGALWAVRFDAANLEIDGDPVAVIERVGRRQTAANLVLSRRGTLAYSPASDNDDRSLVWVDRQGREQPIMAPVRRYGLPRLSTDGSRIAVAITDDARGAGFWIWDFSLQRLTPLSGRSGGFSVWSPDNRHLIFNAPADGARGATNVFRRAVNGAGVVERLTSSEAPQRPVAISPDGKHLVFEQETPESSHHLMVLSLDSASTSAAARRTAPLLDSPSDERNASIAPDGRWMAYESNKTGQSQIYVKPFPNVNDAEYQSRRQAGVRRYGRPEAASCSSSTGPR